MSWEQSLTFQSWMHVLKCKTPEESGPLILAQLAEKCKGEKGQGVL